MEIGQGTYWSGSYALEICEGLSHQINIPAHGQSYQWATGQTSNTISITRAGNYGFSFVDMGGCIQSDTIYVTAILPEALVYIPNAFTPNGDGINDLFKVEGEEIEEFHIRVFNRWGEMVFESENRSVGWNGSLHNSGQYHLPDGIYPYVLKYKGTCEAERIELRGFVTILR